MKRTPASPEHTLSPFGGAVPVGDAGETAADDRDLVVLRDPDELPPILAGHQIPQLRARAASFYAGVAAASVQKYTVAGFTQCHPLTYRRA
jgi:hypothetical protein